MSKKYAKRDPESEFGGPWFYPWEGSVANKSTNKGLKLVEKGQKRQVKLKSGQRTFFPMQRREQGKALSCRGVETL